MLKSNQMHSQSRVYIPESVKLEYLKGKNLYFAMISDHHIIAMQDGIPEKIRKSMNAVPFGKSTGGRHIRVPVFKSGTLWFANDENKKILHIFHN